MSSSSEQFKMLDTNLTKIDKRSTETNNDIIQESDLVNKNPNKITKVSTLNPYKNVPTLHFKLNGKPPPA